MSAERAERAVEAPLGRLEQSLIDEFLRDRGYPPALLAALPSAEQHALLKEASVYASGRLMEVESRANFLHELHDRGHGTGSGGGD